jgi:ABC-type sugar transport system ATPase subunit
VKALDGVTFDVAAGEVHALVGENGAGKSTLMKVLGGAYVADEGQVLLDGVPLPSGDPLAVRNAGVQVIYQELMLVPALTAEENIFLGRERSGSRAGAQAILDDLGADVDARTPVERLSVPKQQMVEIARSLASASKVLVLDEPTSTLPKPDVKRLLELVHRLKDRGLGIIYISHRLEEVIAIADRITVLRDGKTIETRAQFDRADLIRSMVGRSLEEEFPARNPKPGAVVLEARGLLGGVDLDVRAGEIVGLAGLVGSGRTRTGLTLFGALGTAGSIRMNGRPVRLRNPRDALDAGIAYLTEDRKADGVFPHLDLGANITIASLAQFTHAGILDRAAERKRARASAAEFDVRASGIRQLAGTLSGGNQQKALLARFLLEPRRVLILDEPTRGIDVGAKSEIYRLMNRLTDDGLGIIMISSEMEELLGMADRVVVLREGRCVGELSDPTQEQVMELATA